MLQWIWKRQADVSTIFTGLVKKKEEIAIHLYARKPGMSKFEAELYSMFVTAAGHDGVLQNRMFNKWSYKNYYSIDKWLCEYRKNGKYELKGIGVYTDVEVTVKNFWGTRNVIKTQETSRGKELLYQALGFKRYLEDFTIVNERKVCEVELWEKYLIFAHLFGIADRVAEQFKRIYPDYFTRQNIGTPHSDHFNDILLATEITNTFADCMYSGYRSGKTASESSDSGYSSGGGGGDSSYSGGGGGASGGGGAGGR